MIRMIRTLRYDYDEPDAISRCAETVGNIIEKKNSPSHSQYIPNINDQEATKHFGTMTIHFILEHFKVKPYKGEPGHRVALHGYYHERDQTPHTFIYATSQICNRQMEFDFDALFHIIEGKGLEEWTGIIAGMNDLQIGNILLEPINFYPEAKRKGIVRKADTERICTIADPHVRDSGYSYQLMKERLNNASPGWRNNSVWNIAGDCTNHFTRKELWTFIFSAKDSKIPITNIIPLFGNHDILSIFGNGKKVMRKFQVFNYFFFGLVISDSELERLKKERVYKDYLIGVTDEHVLLFADTTTYTNNPASGVIDVDFVERDIKYVTETLGMKVIPVTHHCPHIYSGLHSELRDGEKYLEMLEKYGEVIPLVLSGHVHESKVYQLGRVDKSRNVSAFYLEGKLEERVCVFERDEDGRWSVLSDEEVKRRNLEERAERLRNE